ncbi:hypothetical protein M409DRAFT_50178 [Zasmidium cellare ATCC 36951]|uniref:Uncharacterized protein n=1 Tax=Zasmidium cellare ATCC 36951 TaxID=1080233 RepID=A0A6A6CZ44_ZASCE|nr:uncharacterized protein M409DRAFT_50178 [Zasmidium cellare ATCC 36951]KAF2172487.1 hypothetical protein M409DRAFT_50178 [Zasmidium cellare ATCC 36951]
MGIFQKTIAATGWTTLGAAAGYVAWTRKSKIVDVPPTDYLFNHTLYARYNPNNAPVTQDLCVRKVPLDKIRPELLEHEGKLVEAFSAGLWSGLGYAYQRRYLEKKYRADEVTRDHLWDQQDLKSSTYDVGTKITDHFEVVSKTPTSIIVRCGDSPRIQDVRASDGLFEMQAEIKKDEGVAEFGLKSIFYNGLAQPDKEGKPPAAPMSTWIQWLHQQYDKVLMETAITNCTK